MRIRAIRMIIKVLTEVVLKRMKGNQDPNGLETSLRVKECNSGCFKECYKPCWRENLRNTVSSELDCNPLAYWEGNDQRGGACGT